MHTAITAQRDPSGRTARGPRRSLQIEALELRTMLSGGVPSLLTVPGVVAEVQGLAPPAAAATTNQQYVRWISSVLTAQPLSAQVQSGLVRQLDQGTMTREQAAVYVLRTPQGVRAAIEDTYELLLNRDPTLREVRADLSLAARGADQLTFIAVVLKSPEYFRKRGGGTNSGFVQAMARDLLGLPTGSVPAAVWLSQLARGTSRSRLVDQVLHSPDYIAAASRQIAAHATPGGALDASLVTYVSSNWGGTQPLTMAKARVFGSDTFLATLLQPPPTIPQPPATSLPSAGFPITPSFSVATGWVDIGVPANPESVGASPQGKYWIGTPTSGLIVYDVVARTSTPVWGGVALSIAPISNTQAWLIGTNQWPIQGPVYLAKVDSSGTLTKVADLPSGDVPSQITAAPDGTVWVLGQTGKLYSYQSASNTWAPVSTDGFAIQQISIGSASNIWAIAQGQGATQLLHWSPGTGWSVDNSITSVGGLNPTQVSATADGSVFAFTNFLQTQKLFIRPPGSPWMEVPNQTPPGVIFFMAATDRNRLLAVTLNGDFQVLSVGVVDRPAVAFPEVTSQWAQGYAAVTRDLGIVNPLGIRGLYGDAVSNTLTTWFNELHGHQLPVPANVSQDNWIAIEDQLAAEVNDVIGVDELFTTLNQVNNELYTVNNTTLSNGVTRVGLTKQDQSNSTITLAIEAMFESAFAGIATLFTGSGATIAAMIASGIDSAISDLTGQSNPGPDTKLVETYLKLSSDLKTLYLTTGSTYATEWHKVLGSSTKLGDYGMLTALGQAVNSGLWYIPDGQAQTVAAAGNPAFETFTYQALIPTKWQVVYAHDVICDLYNCPDFNAPTYDQYVVVITGGGNTSLDDIWYLNQIGSGTDPYVYGGPYPTKGLLDHLWNVVGVSKRDFFENANGAWPLKHVNATN